MITLMIATACKTSKLPEQVSMPSSVEVHDRIVTTDVAPDSSIINALFRCDSNNQVILADYNQLYSRFMSVQTAVEPIGNDLSIKISSKSQPAPVTTMAHDSVITKSVPVYIKGDTVEVPAQLSWLHKTLIGSGVLAWLYLLFTIIFKLYKLKKS